VLNSPLRRSLRLAQLRSFVAQNKLFSALFLLGALLRLLTFAAYNSAIMFFGDSWQYLIGAQQLHPRLEWPYGYSLAIRGLSWTHWFPAVPLAQHVGGLALALLLYRFLIGRNVSTRVAAIAAAPVLLDGYQIGIEQYLMSETLFELLLVGGIIVLLRRSLTMPAALLVSGLLAAAMVTRAIALPVAILAMAYLALRRERLRAIAAAVGVLAATYVGYGLWFHHYYGQFGVEESASHFLYGRVAPFARCGGLHLPPVERPLCQRMVNNNPTSYAWSGRSPYYNLSRRVGVVTADKIVGRFDRTVIEHQPVTYARVVTEDTLHFFSPLRRTSGWDYPVKAWLLPNRTVEHRLEVAVGNVTYSGGYRRASLIRPLAVAMRDYQSVVYTYGPLLAAGLVVMGTALLRRRPLRAPPEVDEASLPPRADLALLLAVAVVLLVVPNATVVFDYRYLLPAIPFVAAGAALACARLWPSAALVTPAAAETPVVETQKPPRTRARLVVAGTVVVALVLALAAPLRLSRLFLGYVYAGASAGSLGAPVGKPQPVPGYPHKQLQRYQNGEVVESIGRLVITVPGGIAPRLTPQEWLTLGLPTRCSPPNVTDPEWCIFQHGRLSWRPPV
jgi:multisubunit Na+/H+ antiporter MnhF subunit